MSEKLSEYGAKTMSATMEASMRLQEMGRGLTDEGKWHRLRTVLGWHQSVPSRVRHLYYGHAKPTAEEMDQIRLAHARHCLTTLSERDNEDRQLLATFLSLLGTLEAADPEFHRPTIEALRETARQLGKQLGDLGDKA